MKGKFDLNKFLPESGRYVTLHGSLTTAPCTEGVLWVNMLEPIGITPEQVGCNCKMLGLSMLEISCIFFVAELMHIALQRSAWCLTVQQTVVKAVYILFYTSH